MAKRPLRQRKKAWRRDLGALLALEAPSTLAKVLGCQARTVREWAAGASEPPRVRWTALAALRRLARRVDLAALAVGELEVLAEADRA